MVQETFFDEEVRPEATRAKSCRSPLIWVGGKWYQSKHLVKMFPPHVHYVEVFGGAAHVLCAKPSEISALETYNDVNQDVVNFFLTARDNWYELLRVLHWTPYSRQHVNGLWEKLWDGSIRGQNKVQWATDWFTLVRQSFAGNIASRGKSWAYSINDGRRGMGITVSAWRSAIQRLEEVADRFRGVQIECDDFRNIIRRYDDKGTFFYCDPPFVGTEGYYAGGFGEQDHRDLAALLRGIKGKVLLNYHTDALVDELYGDWRRESVDAVMWSQPTRAAGDANRTKKELLCLMNY